MVGNSIGQSFRVTTFGESHGPALGGIVDGVPPGLPLDVQDIQKHLDLRRPGFSAHTTRRREPDKVNILSGVFKGFTTGSSIGITVGNFDQNSGDYEKIKDLYRPGHADYSYDKKYGIRDHRGGGRSSARETVIRVAAGAIARKYLALTYGTDITGFLSQIGPIKCQAKDVKRVRDSRFFCPDPEKIEAISDLIDKLISDGDSIGAKISVVVTDPPPGLGEPVFDRLDADLAHALMSINAVKGVEIGDGFSVVEHLGSENRDEITPEGFKSNHSGGILGGISTGQTIVAHLALKATPSIRKPGTTINRRNERAVIEITGRHDPCVGIRAVPVAEAMTAIVLMDHAMRRRAQIDEELLGRATHGITRE